MRTKRALRVTAIVLAALVSLVWGGWLIAVPEEIITDRVHRGLKNSPVEASFEGLSKGLFFTIRAEAVSVVSAKSGKEIALLEDVEVGLNVSSLMGLNPCVDLKATVASGSIEGTACSDDTLDIDAEGVDMSGLGLERSLTGLRAGGIARAGIHTVKGAGEVRFDIKDMAFLPYRYMGFSLPLDLLSSARGLVLIDGNVATVKSASLEGDGIFARASGKIGAGRVDMKLEIMPSEEFEMSQPYFNMLQSYRITQGLYEIPLSMSY